MNIRAGASLKIQLESIEKVYILIKFISYVFFIEYVCTRRQKGTVTGVQLPFFSRTDVASVKKSNALNILSTFFIY